MWNTGLVFALTAALLAAYFSPTCTNVLKKAWQEATPYLLLGLETLLDATERLMFPLLRFCGWRPGQDPGGKDQLPACLRNPMDAEKDLKVHTHLAILGHVFDVATIKHIYGRRGTYAHFTGKDATRLLLGADEKGYALDGLTSDQLHILADWLQFYANKYSCMGKCFCV